MSWYLLLVQAVGSSSSETHASLDEEELKVNPSQEGCTTGQRHAGFLAVRSFSPSDSLYMQFRCPVPSITDKLSGLVETQLPRSTVLTSNAFDRLKLPYRPALPDRR